MPVNKITELNNIAPKRPPAKAKESCHSSFWEQYDDYRLRNEPDFNIDFSKDHIFGNNSPVANIKDLSKQTGLRESFIQKLIEMEGFRTSTYLDSAGIKTIGIGHNIEADKNYRLGNKITKEQAYGLLKQDLLKAESQVNELTNGKLLKRGQKEALVDLVFNVGPKKIENTKLINYIKSGQYEKAIREFNYIKVGQNVNTHLCQRRVQNIGNFFEDKPTKQVIATMEDLQKKGEEVYNQKLK